MDKKGNRSGSNSQNPSPNDDPAGMDDLDDDTAGDDTHCVYTYKGGHPGSADLPSSFMYLPDHESGPGSSAGSSAGLTLPGLGLGSSSLSGAVGSSSGGGPSAGHPGGGAPDPFSPDMDFLEMDFDPGTGPEDEDDEDFNQDDTNELESLEMNSGSVTGTNKYINYKYSMC